MKLTLFAVSAIVAVVSAQSTWYLNLPPCAIDCAKKAADAAKCDIRDLKCLCNSRIFPQVFQECLYANCGSVVGPAAYDLWKKYCYNSTATVRPTTTKPTFTIVDPTIIDPTITVKPTKTQFPTVITDFPTLTVDPVEPTYIKAEADA